LAALWQIASLHPPGPAAPADRGAARAPTVKTSRAALPCWLS